MKNILLSVFFVALTGVAVADNASIERKISGRYAYTNLSGDTNRGEEAFQMFVHPDKSRTLMIWHDLAAKDAQFSVVLRAAADFRPLSAYVSYWVEAGYKGHTLFSVDGNTVTASSFGPQGAITASTKVPQQFSIGTHPVAGDGWHLWYAGNDPDASGNINLFSVEASADLEKPILGQLVQMPVEVIGNETVTTSAGEFDTVHYRMMGATDLWVTGEDRILVKMVMQRFDRLYELVELEVE